MQRILFAAVVSAIWGICGAGLALAQRTSTPVQNEKNEPTGTTRVAVINFVYIFQKYERASLLKAENTSEMKRNQDEGKRLMEQINGLQTALQRGDFKGATKEEVEEKLIDSRRRFEDLNRKVTVQFGKIQQAQLVSLFTDIRAEVKSYMQEHGIDLVVSTGDPIQADALLAFPNVDRKMRMMDQGGLTAFLVGPGVDISEAVTERLNRRFRADKSKTADKTSTSAN